MSTAISPIRLVSDNVALPDGVRVAQIKPSIGSYISGFRFEGDSVNNGFRAAMRVLRLGREVGPERLEAACARAVALGACRYRSIKAILDAGLDRQSSTTSDSTELPDHDNVRGPQYYH